MAKLTVVGGVYRELCHFPVWRQLYGSGTRAAFAARHICSAVDFHAAVGDLELPDLQAMADAFDVELHATKQPNTISFEYFHGLATPRIWPVLPSKTGAHITVNADAILRFGILEADGVVHGKRVVYDPQSPTDPRPFAENGSTAQELGIVLNRGEGALLTGERESDQIAKKLFFAPEVVAVVVKQGPEGALVVTRSGSQKQIPAYETEAVFPIGSGDVFSAIFAARWATGGVDAVAAAEFASIATAYYCSTRTLPIPATEQEIRAALPSLRALKASKRQDRPKCYLAGPFFTMGQRWLVEEAREALLGQGLDVFSPYHEVGLGHAAEVVPKDLAAIRDCELVFAIVDGLDSGTLFEVGYARSRDIPVIAFAEREEEQDLKLLRGSECRIEKDFTTAIYRANWVAYGR